MEWTKEDLTNFDCRTRKIMTVNRCVHSRSNMARLYLPWKKGCRGLISVEDCVSSECKSLYKDLENSDEWMLKAALCEKVIIETESLVDYKKCIHKEGIEALKGKPLHSAISQNTDEVADEVSWRWMRNGVMKKETEGNICAAQEQANAINCNIGHTADSV